MERLFESTLTESNNSDENLIQELTHGEDKHRMADNMTDLIAIIDKNGVLKYASPSHYSILGYSPERCNGKLAFDLVHPENLSDVLTRFIVLFETSGSEILEYRTKHETKGWVWIETKASIFFDKENGEKHLLIVSREIEERKSLQEKL